MLLDQAVLEHERPELRVRALVIDHGRLDRPVRRQARGREVGAGTAADRDRLADVQHPAGVVSEQVHAGILGQLAEVELGRRGQRRDAALAARRAPAARVHESQRIGDRQRVRAQPREHRAQHARARLRVGERAVRGVNLDPERIGEHAQPALVLQRQQLARERRGAEDGRVRPVEADQLERAAQHAAVERRVVRHQHPAFEELLQRRQDGLEAGGIREHLLRDPGEPLNSPAERPVASHERGPAIVELATADQHRAHLGHLARIPAEAVGLGVHDKKLRTRDRLLEQRHARVIRVPPDGKQAGLQRSPSHL